MRSELATGTVRLHQDISGDGDAPVILLHGLFGSGSNLMALGRALSPYFRVVRLDLRNHGRSGHSEVMDLPRMAADVLAAMDDMGLANASVVGHSLGGKVAMELAIEHPERVSRLVVADIAPVRYGRGHDDILAALLGLDLRALESREQADRQLQAAVPELAVRQFLLKNLRRNADGGWLWQMNLPAIAANYDKLSLAPSTESYQAPTLFIRGGASDYVKDEYRAAIQRQFPNVGIHTIDDAGHWLHAERPQIFNEVVLQFLRGSDAR